MKVKICSKCEKELPATIEYFYRDKNRKDGLNYWCKECCRKYRQSDKGKKSIKKYFKENKEKILECQKKYSQSEEGKLTQKRSDKKHYEKNKLSKCISVTIRKSLKGNKNGHHWENLVGYNLEKLKQHLESLFHEGMNWDNQGKWHVDHIKPISSFNITSYDCEDFQECWTLENLQPLWAKDNLSKGAKYL